ncbi:hypothetical protein [Actinophytocola oryzae]|uniref:hypothetical protein n=1 Tax=Actinophytocola oryzae TaxID=502181 RepID=UPI0010625FA0|nr:hypothetical protein [Actinophytocola oryzae]
MDVLSGRVDGAVVISNDSDLGLPLRTVGEHVPLGVVNPSTGYLASALQGHPDEGVGRHWWRQLTKDDYTVHQLPDPAGGVTRPVGW